MAIISSNPAMHDLSVTHHESTLVFPCQQTQTRTMFLSNIDQFLNFNVSTAHFFRANLDFPPETVAQRLKAAVERVLVPYDFMAGRLRWNHEFCRAEIDCNAAGVGFVVASSQLSLDEIGDLACPNQAFKQLVVHKLDGLDAHNQPLCVFQITSFRCGGFAMGTSLNHILIDGMSAKMFHENLASQAFEAQRPLACVPFHDRRLLAARSPPLVTFSHPELFKHPGPVGLTDRGDNHGQALDHVVFKISSEDIAFLKTQAKLSSGGDETIKITSFTVVAALVWRCRAVSSWDVSKNRDAGEAIISVCSVMDLRPRLAEVPGEYCGNAIYGGYASAKCKEIKEWPFSKLVRMVWEGVERVTGEYARSAIDWMEMNKGGMPSGDCIITPWPRLGFDQVVYPWGKPACCVPVVNQIETMCWILPNHDTSGMHVLVQRPPKEMERFICHFQSFFSNN